MDYIEETQKENLKIIVLLGLMAVLLVGFSIFCGVTVHKMNRELRSATPTILRSEIKVFPKWSGLASYYSEDGCIGCSDDLTMANGRRFDENAMTVAFNKVPLGTTIRVVNVATGKEQIAEVTDRGGFEDLGRILDLSQGLKIALGCTDLCKVDVYIK